MRPYQAPKKGGIKAMEKGTVNALKKRHVTDEICIANPKRLDYLLDFLEIDDKDGFREVKTSAQTIALVSDGGLKDEGGFGWVAARDDKIIAVYHCEVHGSQDQLSLFRTEDFIRILGSL